MYLNMYINNAVQISSVCDCDWYGHALYDFCMLLVFKSAAVVICGYNEIMFMCSYVICTYSNTFVMLCIRREFLGVALPWSKGWYQWYHWVFTWWQAKYWYVCWFWWTTTFPVYCIALMLQTFVLRSTLHWETASLIYVSCVNITSWWLYSLCSRITCCCCHPWIMAAN